DGHSDYSDLDNVIIQGETEVHKINKTLRSYG
ncbi:unnamed protein product, partial [Allacma fusca]